MIKQSLKTILLVVFFLANVFTFNTNAHAEADITKPVFIDMSVSAHSVSIGDKITFTVNATDDMSGIQYVSISYLMPQTNKIEFVSLNKKDGKYVGQKTITDSVETGTWKIVSIVLMDNANNMSAINNNNVNIFLGGIDLSVGDYTIVKDNTPPVAPTINPVTDQATIVIGLAEANTKIDIWNNSSKIGTGITKEDGKFSIGITKQLASTKLTITSTDASGNVSNVVETIVVDAQKPTFNGVNDTTIQYGEKFDSLKNVIAIDNLDSEITSKIKVEGAVNTAKVGLYILTYTVSDNAGNVAKSDRKIKVVDNVKPKIIGVSSKTIKFKSVFNSKVGVIATDNADGNLTKKIKIQGTVNTKKKGKYSLVYSVSDNSGNKAIVKRTIIVK